MAAGEPPTVLLALDCSPSGPAENVAKGCLTAPPPRTPLSWFRSTSNPVKASMAARGRSPSGAERIASLQKRKKQMKL